MTQGSGAYRSVNPITITVTTAGTQQQVSATDRPVRGFWAKSRTANTGAAVIGDASVSVTDGFELPEINSMFFEGPFNLFDVWVDVTTDSDKVDIWPVE